MKSFDLGVFLVALIGMGILVFIATAGEVNKYWRTEAVKRGFAEYVADEKGESVWQWKEAK